MIKIGIPNNIFFQVFSFIKEKGFFSESKPFFIPVDNFEILEQLFIYNELDCIFTKASFLKPYIGNNNPDFTLYPLLFKNTQKIFISKTLFNKIDKNVGEIKAGIPQDADFYKAMIINYLAFNQFTYSRIKFKSINEKDVEFYFQKGDIDIASINAPFTFKLMEKNIGLPGNYFSNEQNILCNCFTYFLKTNVNKNEQLKFFDELQNALKILIYNNEFLIEFISALKSIKPYFLEMFFEELKTNIVFFEDAEKYIEDHHIDLYNFLVNQKSSAGENIPYFNSIDDKVSEKEICPDDQSLFEYHRHYIKRMLNRQLIPINQGDAIPKLIALLYNNLIYEYQIQTLKLLDNKNMIAKLETSLEETKGNLYHIFEEFNKTSENLLIQKIRTDEANKSKSKFFASITHDLKTPITGVVSMSEILIDKEETTEKREKLELIHQAGLTLLNLIEEILTISKAEEKKLTIVKKIFDFSLLLKEVRANIEAKLGDSGVDLMFEIQEGLPTALIGDGLRIKQILYNLLGNAIKFTEKGFIKLIITFRKKDGDKIELIIDVKDSGKGIEAARLDSIFEPFEQENDEIQFKYGGTGLGLSIVKKLVELMSGSIVCESQLNEGTVFHLNLELEFDPNYINMPVAEKKGKGKNNKINLKPCTILIAEDNEINKTVLKEYLQTFNNLSYSIASNGEDALAEFLNRNYDLVLTDIQMPKMDGITFARQLRENKFYLPIIAFTAYDKKEIQNDHPGLFNEVADKPYSKDQFIDIFTRYVGLNECKISDTKSTIVALKIF